MLISPLAKPSFLRGATGLNLRSIRILWTVLLYCLKRSLVSMQVQCSFVESEPFFHNLFSNSTFSWLLPDEAWNLVSGGLTPRNTKCIVLSHFPFCTALCLKYDCWCLLYLIFFKSRRVVYVLVKVWLVVSFPRPINWKWVFWWAWCCFLKLLFWGFFS